MYEHLSTKTEAINERCKECIYDPSSGGGTWRQQVESCTSENSCALWKFRPLTKPTMEKLRKERIENMTPEEREIYERRLANYRRNFRKEEK